jgi:hypothetical protein
MMLIAENVSLDSLGFFGGVPWTARSTEAIDRLIDWRNRARDFLRTRYNVEDRPYEDRGKATTWQYASSINPVGTVYNRHPEGMSLYEAEIFLPLLDYKSPTSLLTNGRKIRANAEAAFFHEDQTGLKRKSALAKLEKSGSEHVNEGYLSAEDAQEGRRADDFYFDKLSSALRDAIEAIKNPPAGDIEIKKAAVKKGAWVSDEEGAPVTKEPKVVITPEGTEEIIYVDTAAGEATALPYAAAGAGALILWLLL